MFLEALFGALREDFGALRKDVGSDVKAIKEVRELGQQVDSLECAGDWREEQLSTHSGELLEMRDKNEDVLLRLEDLENRSRLSNICIRGAPLQADAEAHTVLGSDIPSAEDSCSAESQTSAADVRNSTVKPSESDSIKERTALLNQLRQQGSASDAEND
ncbi:hypothetical protein NDU88_002423 [Pleurodeles waltl]|uniref:Uncharacterized protein n=1 Tax=Pleurodeles waltl TaxID=8319 RepID=A0AAV7KVM8_PLEWA|nr:hypothetical protein NDU88_002423 [Pleurodeles waltl]